MKKILIIIIGILLMILAISQKSTMIESIESGNNTAIFVSSLFVALLVFFPVVPFPVVAGLIGSVFGILLGTSISLLGITIGMMTMFWMARYGFQDWVQKTLQKYPKAQEYESYFEQNAFIGILIVRLVPVIPSPLVNILCGISKVRWYTFLSASLIGKTPAVMIFTIAGSVFEGSKLISISIYAVYFLIIMVLTIIYYKRKQPVS
ncbi:TVP38/TMEM64 family protein [bacterium LRH843]|nr:TVP38/TMEM64 family protein [bacterium LRH843]